MVQGSNAEERLTNQREPSPKSRSLRRRDRPAQVESDDQSDPRQAAVESPGAALVYLDSESTIRWVDPAFTQITGRCQEELVGRNYLTLFATAEGRAAFERARDTGRPAESTSKPLDIAYKPDRGVTHWDWSLTPVKGGEGIAPGFIFSLRDVTGRTRAETEREKMQARLRWEAEVHAALSAVYEPLVSPFTSTEHIVGVVLDQALSLTASPEGCVAVIDPVSGEVVVQTCVGMAGGNGFVTARHPAAVVPPGMEQQQFAAWVSDLATKKAFFDNAPETQPAYSGSLEHQAPLRRVLSAPVVLGQAPVGHIALANAEQDYTELDLEAVTRLGGLYALAVQRRRYEDLLRKQHNLASAILDTAGSLILVLDRQGRIVRFNRACEQITGHTLAEASGKDYWDVFLLPEDVEPEKRVFAGLPDGEYPARHDSCWLTRDGRRRWISWTSTALTDDLGAVEYVVRSGIDVTEHRQYEQKLRTLIELLPIGISVLGPSRRFQLVNSALSEILHLTEDQLLSGEHEKRTYVRTDGSPFPPSEFPSNRAVVEEQLIRDVEIGVVKAEGQHIWTRVSAAPLPFDDWRVLIATVDITDRIAAMAALRQARDDLEMRVIQRTADLAQANQVLRTEIVDRQRAEEELRASELRFHQLADNLDVVFWLIEPDCSELVYLSPAYEKVWGRSTKTLANNMNALLDDVYPPDRETTFRHMVDYTVETTFEFRVVRPDGELRWIQARQFPVRNQTGKIYRVAAIAADVTVEKQIQASLIETERLAITGKLAASLAHEINNPLQAAIGCLDLSLEQLEQGEDPRRHLRVTANALDRASRVVKQLQELHFPATQEVKEQSDLNQLLENVLVLIQRRCNHQHIEVKWRPAPDIPPILLMPDSVQQVFLNLALNALDAMTDGGQLWVSTCRSQEPPAVMVRFTDSGHGIPSDALAHVFEPFFSTKSDSLGLGLFISQNIVHQHGGLLEVESQEGRGTTFTVLLPLASSESSRTFGTHEPPTEAPPIER